MRKLIAISVLLTITLGMLSACHGVGYYCPPGQAKKGNC